MFVIISISPLVFLWVLPGHTGCFVECGFYCFVVWFFVTLCRGLPAAEAVTILWFFRYALSQPARCGSNNDLGGVSFVTLCRGLPAAEAITIGWFPCSGVDHE